MPFCRTRPRIFGVKSIWAWLIKLLSFFKVIQFFVSLLYLDWWPGQVTHHSMVFIWSQVFCIHWYHHLSQCNNPLANITMGRPDLQAIPTEFFTTETTDHVITSKTFLYWVIAKWAVFNPYTSNQGLFFAVFNHLSIPFMFLSEHLGFLTSSWPVSIFLALETPCVTTEACHWQRLDTTTVLRATDLGGVLCYCCLDNQLALVCWAPFPLGAYFQYGVHPFCHMPSIKWWCK